MAIRYSNLPTDEEGGVVGIELVCDYCEDPITDAAVNIALISDDGTVYFAHQGPCHDALERQSRARAKDGGFIHISRALEQLAGSLSRDGTTRVEVRIDREDRARSATGRDMPIAEYTADLYARFEERVREKNRRKFDLPGAAPGLNLSGTNSDEDDSLPF